MIIYCPVELGGFVAVDESLVIRVLRLQVVGLQVVVVEPVDAGPPVLQLVAELLTVLHPLLVRRVAAQADAELSGGELSDGEPRRPLRMMPCLLLPQQDEAVVWMQPGSLPLPVPAPLVEPVLFAERQQGLHPELRWWHLSFAQQPSV